MHLLFLPLAGPRRRGVMRQRHEAQNFIMGCGCSREGVGMKILVVDDDRDMVDLLTYWLRSYGYEITRAFDGDQAVTRWRESKPDLVILDVELPKMDGFEVCRRMSGESTALVLFLTCRDKDVDEV